MRLFLSRQYDGRYMLSRLQPKRARMLGTDHDALYLAAGEPVGVAGLCSMAERLAGADLKTLQSVQVNLTMKPTGLPFDIPDPDQ